MNQLEFKLTQRNGHRSSPVYWRYRFAKDGLVEELGNTRYVYGLWHRLFGCWQVNTETGASREIIPTWEILHSNGIWADPVEVRFPEDNVRAERFSEKWRFEANAAFAGFFSDIPQRFRCVVGSLGCHQWLALDLIWQCPEFARFLDQELFEASEQYVFACFALAKAQRLPRSGRMSFARSLMHRKRYEFLSEITGIRCTKATLRVLNKLGSAPHPVRIDLTSNRRYSISPKSIQILRSLEFPIRVETSFTMGNDVHVMARDLLAEYAEYSDQFILGENKNFIQDPTGLEEFAARYKISSFEEALDKVVLEYRGGERLRIVKLAHRVQVAAVIIYRA